VFCLRHSFVRLTAWLRTQYTDGFSFGVRERRPPDDECDAGGRTTIGFALNRSFARRTEPPAIACHYAVESAVSSTRPLFERFRNMAARRMRTNPVWGNPSACCAWMPGSQRSRIPDMPKAIRG
jgi:hypothetical protein